jgi:hypothetical protein
MLYRYAECHFVEGCILFIVIQNQNVLLLSVVMQSVVMVNVVMVNVVMVNTNSNVITFVKRFLTLAPGPDISKLLHL